MKTLQSFCAILHFAALFTWCLGPLAWQFLTSIKPNHEITSLPVEFLPKEPTLDHYRTLFERRPFGRYLLNSVIAATGGTLLCLLVAAPAAYALARLRPKGSQVVLIVLVAISLFPAIAFFFPIYEMARAAGALNNPLALAVPYATFNLPLSVLILMAFFRTIPHEVEEAALVDGVSRLQMLWKIMLPLAAPGLATCAILAWIASWNDFLISLTLMPRDASRTITVAIASLSGGSFYELPWGLIGAAICISVAPLLVLVALFQRRIVEGLTQGANVG